MSALVGTALMFAAPAAGQVLGPASPAAGHRAPLDSALRALRYPLRVEAGALVGAGAELLRAALERTQFVALGEEHNTRAVPQLAAALFRMAHDGFGFDYLALEEGPYLGALLSTASREGGRDSVRALGRRYPNAFHMYTEDELDMIGEIGCRSTAARDPVWGLNQEFGAAHAYARLVTIAQDAAARAVAQELLAQALAYEGERFQQNVHYMVEIARPEHFERLRGVSFRGGASEADRLITQLALSNRIYAPYRSGRAPPPGAFHEAGRARETNMKRLFGERYREAEASGTALPKVLVKSGHLHLYRGLSPRTELYTLGNLLSELAVFHGLESLHLYAIVDRPYVRDGWLGPFARVALPGEATLFDLRSLAGWARREEALDPNVRRLIMGYDVLVFLRDGAAGSLEGLRTPRFRWYPEPN